MQPYRVRAYNTAQASENKIHDDAVARRFGFTGGLVPGVDVYAYMAHAPVARFGRDWLERGTATCRFGKPVYDGDEAVVLAEPGADGLELRVESRGEICATGLAMLPDGADAAPIERMEPMDVPADRPPASEETLAPGTRLSIRPLMLTAEFNAAYLEDVRETDPIYAREGLGHPGMVLRTGNWLLSHNVVLGPWMHVGSTVRNLGCVHVGEEATAHGTVSANYERKGHRFVELDALVFANGTPVARLTHVAIYRPRQAV